MIDLDAISNLFDQVISALFLANEDRILDQETLDAVAAIDNEIRAIAFPGEELAPPSQSHDDVREDLADLLGDLTNTQMPVVLTQDQLQDIKTILEGALTLLDDLREISNDLPIRATTGDDTITAETSDDETRAGRGDDLVFGTSGSDTLFGNAGNDSLRAGQGDDLLVGGDGSDTLVASGGDDTLRGGPGDDVLRGGAGDDILRGGPGYDRVQGGAGDDRLYAGADGAVLIGGRGDDILLAGDGADRFIFRSDFGSDTLRGFDVVADSLTFYLDDATMDDLLITETQGGTLISYGDDSLFLVGVTDPSLIVIGGF